MTDTALKTARSALHPGPARDRLNALIRERSLLAGEFTLASGKASGFFFNMKRTMLDPEGAWLIADGFLDLMGDIDCEYVGGLAMGAIPLVATVAARSFERGRPVSAFFVRKEAKDHGTMDLIEGLLEDKSRVVLLEDVTTTGGSSLKAAAVCRARSCIVSHVLTIVDREQGATENFAREGIELRALYRRSDFADAAAVSR
ncbi:MAG: orotate phosphoribosyltransferase [Dongiaceae bacterium]